MSGSDIFDAAERSFLFVFPKQIDGKPLLTSEDDSLMLEFDPPSIRGVSSGRGYMEFKPEKMVYKGELAY